MKKIWLCGITQNSCLDIDEMTSDIHQYFDGLIFVDHQSEDGTKEILDARKGAGEIISLPFLNFLKWAIRSSSPN